MKIRHAFFALLFLGLLSACSAPQPVESTATPVPEVSTPTRIVPTPTISSTSAPTRTRRPSETPSATPTPQASTTPKPTPTSPYPVGPGTPLPDPGFPEIIPQNAPQLAPVFAIVQQSMWQSAASRDGQKLFIATNNGIFVYDRQGQQLAHWPSIILHNLPCESCLSINTDGSRFAATTHKEGKWLAQVYNVSENNASLLIEKPIEAPVRGLANEVRVAISPDGLLLAYGAADGETVLIDMNNSQTLLTNAGGADSIIFSPDGLYFVVRRARLMMFWKTSVWKNPISLQLPEVDSPYVFSSDGKRMAVAQSDKIVAYSMDTLRPNREISIPTPKDLKRPWELAFLDGKTLAGYNARWDAEHTKATVDVAQWDLDTGTTLQMATSETDSPDALSVLWGVTIPLTVPAPGPVALGQYSVFRFVDQDRLLVNSLHSACWLTLSSGAAACFDDPKYKVLSSQDTAYREIPQRQTTLLQDWNGNKIYELAAPYPYLLINATAEYFMVNAKDSTTDLYFKVGKLPRESLPGTLLSYVENAGHIVFNTRQKPSGVMISMVDKGALVTSYQKKGDFMLKPLAIDADNRVYFVQQDVGQPQVILKAIDGKTYAITGVARLSLPAEPQMMSISSTGVFAFGLQDGSVAIVSHDGLQVTSFQAVYTPISGLSLTPDGRYLAVASDDGIRVFAVLP